MAIITVVYTDKILSDVEVKDRKQYKFKSNYDELKIGDLIKSPNYTTRMQIVDISYNLSNTYKVPLKTIQITSINDKDINKIISDGENSNIELVAPTYKIESKKYNFKVEVSSLERAKEIQHNLEHTSTFIEIILKYADIEDKNLSGRNYIINKEGILEEIILYYSSTSYDNWDGRAPIHYNWTKKLTIQELNNSIIPKIKDLLEKSIFELKKIMSGINSFSYKILKELKIYDKIKELEDDLKFLNN